MSGLADAREVAILNNEFGGALYLRLLTGTAGQTANDNGTLPGGCTEITGGGYSPISIPANFWAAAVAGAPTTKTMPTAAHSPVSVTLSISWTTCGYAWTSNNSTISSSNLISSGVWVDTNSNPIVKSVGANEPFQITTAAPIVERLGDPPAGINPT